MSKNTNTIKKYSNLIDDYHVYILECSDGTFYTGITNDLIRRMKMHNSGFASKYTKSRLPVKYVFIESGFTKSDALKREIAIKKLSRDAKIRLINDPTVNEIETTLTC